ncbi:MAG: PKD domain-containing protein [Phycisphaerales bacterium]|nr:PKD domain-containing protein [Phycisphaerales bacterium]
MKYYLLKSKRLIILSLFLLWATVSAFSQKQVSILTAAFQTAIPYQAGSSICVPFNFDHNNAYTCFNIGNSFQLWLSDATGSFTTPTLIGNYTGIYIGLVNGVLPAGLTGTGFKIAVVATNPAMGLDTTPAFSIDNSASAGNLTPTLSLATQQTSTPLVLGSFGANVTGFGWCNYTFTPTNKDIALTAGASQPTDITTTGSLINGITNTIISTNRPFAINAPNGYSDDVTGLQKFNYAYLATNTYSDGVYTAISTVGYYLINNPIGLGWSTSGNNFCINQTVSYGANTGVTGSLYNFPSTLYTVDWNDGTPIQQYTYCDFITNPFITHSYTQNSCGKSGSPQNAYNIATTAVVPYSGVCNTPVVTNLSAFISSIPIANFTLPKGIVDTIYCINNQIRVTNTSTPGANVSGNCDTKGIFNWYINGVFVQSDTDLVQNSDLIFTPTKTGTTVIKLVAKGTIGSPCVGDSTIYIKNICVDTSLITRLTDGGGNTTYISCPPATITLQGTVNPPPYCAPPTLSPFQVIDSATRTVLTPGTDYVITNGNTLAPTFTMTVPRTYLIIFTATNVCGTFTSDTFKIVVLPTPSVSFPQPVVNYCDTMTINFRSSAAHIPTYNPGYSTASIPYSWNITGGAIAYKNGTTQNSPYPVVSFLDYVTPYTVNVTFDNGCGTPATATQTVTFFQPITGLAILRSGTNYCYIQDTCQLTANFPPPNSVDSVRWISSGTGTFDDKTASSTFYTFSTADKNSGSVTLSLRAYPKTPAGGGAASCPVVTQSITITFSAQNKGNNSTQTICSNTAINYIPNSSISGSVFNWTGVVTTGTINGVTTSGTGNITDLLMNPSNNLPAGVVIYTITPFALGCNGTPFTFTVNVEPLVQVNIANIKDTICPGTSANVRMNTLGQPLTYTWTSSFSGNITGNTNRAVPTATGQINDILNNNGTTVGAVYYTINSIGSGGCDTTINDTVYVRPLVTAPIAGRDTALCFAPSFNLTANSPVTGTGVWTQTVGPVATISNTGIPNPTITGLIASSPGTLYTFVWTIGDGFCPSYASAVNITDVDTIQNFIDNTTTNICLGNAYTITNTTLAGGNNFYVISWQSSTDGVTWATVPSANLSSVTVSPTVTTAYRRLVKSSSCSSVSEPTLVVVLPPLANNSIPSKLDVCINTIPPTLLGSNPTGGNGDYTYQWQVSTDGVNYVNIPGAVNRDLTFTTPFTQTSYYKRIVSSLSCTGTSSINSNIDTLTLRLNSIASFTVNLRIACAPFIIPRTNITALVDPSRNASYTWFANGINIGTGASFPGYTISQPSDSVVVSLVTTSPYGCNTDTAFDTLYTFRNPDPSFTVTPTAGCGPLNIAITNTSPDQNVNYFTWVWTIPGTSYTNNTANPAPTTLPASPTAGDINYSVNLLVTNGCPGAYQASKNVVVHSLPISLMALSGGTGCSPYSVTFTDISRGVISRWYLDYNDGTNLDVNTSFGSVAHTYTVSAQTFFSPYLVTFNLCGTDTIKYNSAINVSPNDIGAFGAAIYQPAVYQNICTPDTSKFVLMNVAGASSVIWQFGDGTSMIDVGPNIKTAVSHYYASPGNYSVYIKAISTCNSSIFKDTTLKVNVLPVPSVFFTAAPTPVCIGDSVYLINSSQQGIETAWTFGDGTSSSLFSPNPKAYRATGQYTIKLLGSIFYPIYGSISCSDTVTQVVNVFPVKQGSIIASATTFLCAPATVQLTNSSSSITPIRNTIWKLGVNPDGGPLLTGQSISYTYSQPGVYKVVMTATNAGGCTYADTVYITVSKPTGVFQYDNTPACNSKTVTFLVLNPQGVSQVTFNLDDPSTPNPTLTQQPFIYEHTYRSPGTYRPSVVLTGACSVTEYGDPINVDYIQGGFVSTSAFSCDSTVISFTDVSQPQPTSAWAWNFGDGGTSTLQNPKHAYKATGNYTVRLNVTGSIGSCVSNVSQVVPVQFNPRPSVQIGPVANRCTNQSIVFNSLVQSSVPIISYVWSFSDGYTPTESTPSITRKFSLSGNYTAQVIVSTQAPCYDTATQNILIFTSPLIATSPDVILCQGESSQIVLTVNSPDPTSYLWLPATGLSCNTCEDPIATPPLTTKYKVVATTVNGCSVTDSITTTVLEPFVISISGQDTICSGNSTQLSAYGGNTFLWSPPSWLSNTNISNPIANPPTTTTYTVTSVVNDGTKSCFPKDTQVTIVVGIPLTISIMPPAGGTNVLSGSSQTFTATQKNGDPVTAWVWSPTDNLSCTTCTTPTADIKSDICYTVKATSDLKCSQTANICFSTSCPESLIGIPNVFTPGANTNNIFLIRGQGYVTIQDFVIFSRWGQKVFEVSNCPINDPTYGWNGKLPNGQDALIGTYVYQCTVVCQNGQTRQYKGNVTLLR